VASYSRKTLGLVRDLLNEKAQDFAHKASAIVDYWKPKLFDLGVHNDVINAMSSHSFNWTNIIPAIEWHSSQLWSQAQKIRTHRPQSSSAGLCRFGPLLSQI
jgi:hypothetical protein